MNTTLPPARTEVLVIGGGPAGASAASMLAREQVPVTVLERAHFPRYHIGESLLPSLHPMLDLIGAGDKVRAHGFQRKHGGYFYMKRGAPPGHIDFGHNRTYNFSYQVIRSQFDHLLLTHAREQGATVWEGVTVTEIRMQDGRPTAAAWARRDGLTGEIAFTHVVDASGLTGLMATRVLSNREYQEHFANVAVGAYFRGHHHYIDDDGVPRPGAFVMQAFDDGSGWTWFIPLHDGTASVGVVVHERVYRSLLDQLGGRAAVYAHGIERCPEIQRLIAGAERVSDERLWADYSYVAKSFAEPGWRLAGDAAGFIDPLFSSGVHMAMLGGISAAVTICASRRGHTDEAHAARFHDAVVRRAYARFVVMVAGFYNQIQNQDRVALPGVDLRTFQRAFDLIAPIVSGSADTGELSEQAIRATMEYGRDLVLEMHQVATGNPIARLTSARALEGSLALDLQSIDGWTMQLEPGAIGLARLSTIGGLGESAHKVVVRGLLGAASLGARKAAAP